MNVLYRIARPLLVSAALVLPLTAAHAQTEIKLGHVGEPGSLFQTSADEYAKRVNAKLGGKAKVVAYGSSQLGGDKEMVQKLKLGTLDMALPSTVMSSEVDLFGIFEMPYIVKDRAAHGEDREGDLLAEARSRGGEEGAARSSRSGRTATATSPTTSGRSRCRPT